jgi:mRNA interferase YafQ
MLKAKRTTSFKKDFALAEKRHKDIDKLIVVMGLLTGEIPLPPKHKNHPLHGEWEGSFDCHIQGDWVLIYEIDPAAKTVTFHRTGIHADLF